MANFNQRTTFNHHGVGEAGLCAIHRNRFLTGAFENSGLEIHDTISLTWSTHGSKQPCAASTPKNTDDPPTWIPPGTLLLPGSSSPVGPAAGSSTFSADVALSIVLREDLRNVDQALFCCACNNGKLWRAKAPINHEADTNTLVFTTTSSMGQSSPLPANSSMPASDELLLVVNRQQVAADVHDICAATTQTVAEGTNGTEKRDTIDHPSDPGGLVPTSLKAAVQCSATMLNLGTSIEMEPASSRGTDNVRSLNTTITSNETKSLKMPSSRGFIIPVSLSIQHLIRNCLKRRRSPVDCLSKSKKVKLDQTASHASCASNSSLQSNYESTEPASKQRAQSLISDASALSEESTDSLFYPSPLSTPNTQLYEDEGYPPTLPSTPLPDSVDYARSKANPLARTLAVYRRRSPDVCEIPPVPIIAPPSHVAPTVVRCAEDYAIERLDTLLRKELAERERDGLIVHDKRRRERLKTISGSEPSFSRRGSATSSDSSDICSQLEGETTYSTNDFQGHESAPSVKIQVLTEQHRLADRETWSNMFGIENEFRKEVTKWILEKRPRNPVISGEDHSIGSDLYDQLTNSFETKFHAAHLLHRYFILPEQVEYWRGLRKYEHERGMYGDSEYERSVWHLAVACIALSVKLHRDCLPPLHPVRAAEFLDMAPCPMTHKILELAQRDVLYTLQFQLGSCTPQDVLDELWDALPTLRKATAPIGWTAVQCATWDQLFESLVAPDMLRYPVTLLTAAALINSLTVALTSQLKMGTRPDTNVCKCKALAKAPVVENIVDDTDEALWRTHLNEAYRSVKDVILDVKAVLHISSMELDECMKWLNRVDRA